MTEFMKKRFSVFQSWSPRRARGVARTGGPVKCGECGEVQFLKPDRVGTARCQKCRRLFPRVKGS